MFAGRPLTKALRELNEEMDRQIGRQICAFCPLTQCRAYSQRRCRQTACSRASGRWGRRRDGRCLSVCGCTDSLWWGCRSSRGPPRSCWPGCKGLAQAGWPGTSEEGRERQEVTPQLYWTLPVSNFCLMNLWMAYIFHLKGLLLEPFHS